MEPGDNPSDLALSSFLPWSVFAFQASEIYKKSC